MNKKINLVIACYGGLRRRMDENYHRDRGFYIKKQVEFLNKIKHSLDQITFVINDEVNNDSDFEEALNLIPEKIKDTPVKIHHKENYGMSYSCYDYAFKEYRDKFDYYFFIEDDYLFTLDNFDKKSVRLYESYPDCGFLCGLVYHDPEIHAAISNGLSHKDVLNKVIEKNGRLSYCIEKEKATNYSDNEEFGQIGFSSSIIYAGYEIYDVTSHYNVAFSDFNNMMLFPIGYKNPYFWMLPAQISFFETKQEPEITLKPLIEDDLEFMLEVRNECRNYLHNNSIFNLDDSKKWFKETKPEFYTIYKDDEKIGYFRTSNYNPEEKSIYIGCDIHKDYRGNGYAKIAYRDFIDFIFNHYQVDKINLEVLSNNIRAIHLYEKLNFYPISVKKAEAQRDGKDVDSIVMELPRVKGRLKDLKIQVLLFYYNRPQMVRNALNSLKESTYKNWELCFIDDGSEIPGEPIVREMFTSEELEKTKFYNTNQTKAQKIAQGGSIFGAYANKAMKNTDSDIVIMLCDDDILVNDYLYNLNIYYKHNTKVFHAYSQVIEFNPYVENYREVKKTKSLYNVTVPVNPANGMDACQVSWRIECFKAGVIFPFPKTMCLDVDLFSALFKKFGACVYTGFNGQYKAIHDHQLGVTKSYDIID